MRPLATEITASKETNAKDTGGHTEQTKKKKNQQQIPSDKDKKKPRTRTQIACFFDMQMLILTGVLVLRCVACVLREPSAPLCPCSFFFATIKLVFA
jgi:hypothetical protein